MGIMDKGDNRYLRITLGALHLRHSSGLISYMRFMNAAQQLFEN
jgi:hypothetical protein